MTLEEAKQILETVTFPATPEERTQILQAIQIVAGSFVRIN